MQAALVFKPANDFILGYQLPAFVVDKPLNRIDRHRAQVGHALQPSKQIETILLVDQFTAVHVDDRNSTVRFPFFQVHGATYMGFYDRFIANAEATC